MAVVVVAAAAAALGVTEVRSASRRETFTPAAVGLPSHCGRHPGGSVGVCLTSVSRTLVGAAIRNKSGPLH